MSVKSKEDIFRLLEQHQPQLRELGVRRYGLFGSFVRREQAPDSDIDLLIEFEPQKKTFGNFMALSFFLEELFGRNVQIVTREALSPHIGPAILREVEYAVVQP